MAVRDPEDYDYWESEERSISTKARDNARIIKAAADFIQSYHYQADEIQEAVEVYREWAAYSDYMGRDGSRRDEMADRIEEAVEEEKSPTMLIKKMRDDVEALEFHAAMHESR